MVVTAAGMFLCNGPYSIHSNLSLVSPPTLFLLQGEVAMGLLRLQVDLGGLSWKHWDICSVGLMGHVGWGLALVLQ